MSFENQITVSIIIPVYNRASLIGETLNSILNQTYTYWECIIVDDGSTDNTIQLLEEYKNKDTRIKFFKRPSNRIKGPNACRKYGYELCSGEYIQWFDSDDIMKPEKLSSSLERIMTEEADCLVHNYSYFRPNDYDGILVNQFSKNMPTIEDYIGGKLVLNFQSILWKRSILNIDWMLESISYAEDVYFIGNHFLIPNFRIAVFAEILVFIRKHEEALTTGFSRRSKKLIRDEVFVRDYFWRKNKGNNNQHLSNGSLIMYLKSLKYLLYIKKYKLLFKSLFNVFTVVNFKKKLSVINLMFFSLFYIFTKRGITAFQKKVNSLNI